MTTFHWIMLGGAAASVAVWAAFEGVLRWILLSGVFTLSGLWIGLGVSFPGLGMFGQSLCRIPTARKAVALTFDDGPDPNATPEILGVLAQRDARATFFCVGKRAQQHPELVKRLAREGHQVENHSQAHSHWTNFFSVKRLKADLEQAQAALEKLTGRRPTLFRPPMGLTNLRIFKAARAARLQVTGYTARAFDRRNDTPEIIAARLLRRLEPGAIFLLHDGGVRADQAKAVLERVLSELEALGFECVTIDELARGGDSNRAPASAGPKLPWFKPECHS